MVDFLAQVVLLMGMAVASTTRCSSSAGTATSEPPAGRSWRPFAVASSTTGRAVFYAGITVVLSLVGLFLTNSAIFISMSIGIIIVVLLALLGSLTLIPALLGILGRQHQQTASTHHRKGDAGSRHRGIWGAITDKVLARTRDSRHRDHRGVDRSRRTRRVTGHRLSRWVQIVP